MKIYVSDKYNETLKNKTTIHTPRGCGKDFENYLKIVKEFKKNNQNFMFVFSERSLEQHDKELLKEFALEIINWSLPKYGEDIQIQVANDFETKIRKMLKERGVE